MRQLHMGVNVSPGEMERGLKALQACTVYRVRLQRREMVLLIPRSVYEPDAWTMELLAVLKKYLRHYRFRKCVINMIEVGPGSGIVPIFIDRGLNCHRNVQYIGLDISPVACEAARLNIKINDVRMANKLVAGGDLLEFVPSELRGRVDLIVACIPQVPRPTSEETDFNNYYHARIENSSEFSRFDACGLGLTWNLLRQSKDILSSEGTIILTLAGRPGMQEISAMFAESNMTFSIIRSRRIAQDPLTRIDRLVRAGEERGIRFVFYKGAEGAELLTNLEVVESLRAGRPVYHDLFVVAARKSAN